MTKTVIDFETYYDKDVSVVTLGNPNYVAKADAYIVSASIGGEAFCGTIAEMGDMCHNLSQDPTVLPVAANSNFDQGFWEKYFPKFTKPWHCVLDQGCVAQNPRALAGLAKNVLNRPMDKTTRDEMKGVHYEELTPERQEHVQRYCLNDVIVEAEVCEKVPQMSSFENRVALHTRMTNRRGIQIDTELVGKDKSKLELMRFDAFKKIPWHADYAPLSYPALVRYCNSQGIQVPKSVSKTDEECADMMSDNAQLAGVIGQMRRYRRANTMIKKVETLLNRVTPDGILQMDLLYCGAPHTRRWSSKGFNVQNLDKEPLAVLGDRGDASWEDILSGKRTVEGLQHVWTRNWIIPRPGYTFLVLDYSQIEPRCLNWLIGNEEMMAALRQGFSYYESYAAAAKGWKGAAGTLKKEFGKERYTKLKNECLGCGYGMGGAKYVAYARGGGSIVTEVEAKTIVDGFRKSNPKVTAFWRHFDHLIKTAARDKSKHLAIQMPSGEYLNHFHLRTHGKGYQSFTIKNDFTHGSAVHNMWGGVLTENVCQRMGRDLLANAVVNLEDAGIRVPFHCHDEVICEVPIDSKEEAKVEAVRILQKAPDWAAGLPLGVEGDFCMAYTK